MHLLFKRNYVSILILLYDLRVCNTFMNEFIIHSKSVDKSARSFSSNVHISVSISQLICFTMRAEDTKFFLKLLTVGKTVENLELYVELHMQIKINCRVSVVDKSQRRRSIRMRAT
jgi:hypothetical protein